MEYNKTPRDIEKETGKKFIDLCKDYVTKGFSPTEIAKELKLKSSAYISQTLNREIYNQKKSDKEDLLHDFNYTHKSTIEKLFPDLFGMSYREFLNQKYVIEKMSTKDVSLLLNIEPKTLNRHLNQYGLVKTLSEARQDAIHNGLIDYDKINAKARKTKNKSIVWSSKQEVAREVLKSFFEEFINTNNIDCEIIIGFNEWGILKDKEIDIPIIIIDQKNYNYKKYSIEYSGKHWHIDREGEDKEKESRLKTNGWKHFIIWDSPTNSKVESDVIKVAEEIIKDYIIL